MNRRTVDGQDGNRQTAAGQAVNRITKKRLAGSRRTGQRSENQPKAAGGKRRMERMLTGAIMAVAVLVIVLIVWFQRSVDTVTLADGAFNYFGERKLTYPGTCKLQYKDGEASLKDQEGNHLLDSTPLYTSFTSAVIPYDYVWNDIRTGTLYRLGYFSEIKQENNSIILRDGSRVQEQARGFLYDGVDTYIFLEHVTVTAGEERVELPALSYVVSRYGNTLQYYVGGTDKSVVVKTGEGDQLAGFGNGDTLNLGTDTLYCANGTWQLLVVRPQVLDRID